VNEFLEQFLVEARELVEQATSDLLALERAPSDRECLDGAFRAFHTLKGGAGIVDFEVMSRAVHAAEDVLAAVRAGERSVTPALIGACLACLDQVVRWLDAIDDSGELPTDAQTDADRVVARFVENLQSPEGPQFVRSSARTGDMSASSDPLAILNEQLLLLAVGGDGMAGRVGSAGRVAANVMRYLSRPAEAEQIAAALANSLERLDPRPLASAIEEAMRQTREKPAETNEPTAVRPDPLSRTLRVDAARVSALVDLTGELTVAKNAIGFIAKLAQESDNSLAEAIRDGHEKLDRLVGALQRAVLELRVLPLRGVFQRFSRVVHEISNSLGKPVRLSIEGEDTEVDKSIIEFLHEPLLHVVRNAMDHGVEPGPERAAAGKSAVASIHLRAWREGQHVLVEVEDDGRGVDVANIRKTAVERGVASPDTIAGMSEAAVLDLIFEPGFSTAREITDLSGRGVGLDAARRAIERLGGRVAVETRIGMGSTIRFTLPFSVMMTRVMTVEAGGQKFGIPLDAVLETLRVQREQIHPVGRAQAFVHRNRTIPVIDLGQTLGYGAARAASEATIVVALIGSQLAGLEVERLGERIDIMIKLPDGLLSQVPGIAGTTMLGDGSVLLILEPRELLG
jgi:two-component system, chemotaxis family, sensor kinase CheA